MGLKYSRSVARMQKKTLPTTQFYRRIPLYLVLIVPVVLQIAGIGGLVGYLSFKNEQKTVANFVNQLMGKAGNRIEEQLKNLLQSSHFVSQVNGNVFELNLVNFKNSRVLERYFWRQIQQVDTLQSIGFLSSDGEFIGWERLEAGNFQVNVIRKSKPDLLQIYATDQQGNRTGLYRTIPNINLRQYPGYLAAMKAREFTWSPIFLEPNARLVIASAQPVRNREGKSQGFLIAEVFLSQMSEILPDLKISPFSEIFIIDDSGLLVATSAKEPLAQVNPSTQKIERIKALDSQNLVIKQTAQFLHQRLGKFKTLTQEQNFEWTQDDRRQFVKVRRYADEFGLNWLMVITVPEGDFTTKIYQNYLITAFLCLGAIATSAVFGLITARWISQSILRLSTASQAIGQGNFNQRVEMAGIHELVMLAHLFNQMSENLEQSQQRLEQNARLLAEQVSQRTGQLQEEIRERQLVEEKLRSSETEVRAFFEAMTDIVLIVDAEGQSIKAAPTHPERLYVAGTDILGQMIAQFFSPETSELFYDQVQQALATQQIVSFEYCLQIEAQKFWFVASISPTSENTVAWVARDITTRKKIEEDLRKSEERWQLALRGNNDGIWDFYPQTLEVFYSPRSQEMLGYSESEITHYDQVLTLIHPDDSERVAQVLNDHLARKIPYYSVEYRMRCKDGRYKWIESRGQALWNDAGQAVRLVGSHTDITERKQREEALQLIVEGTAAKTGHEFFQSCVRYLAQVLQVRYAIVTELVEAGGQKLRPIAFWGGEDWSHEAEYELANTPCETVINHGTACFYPDRLAEQFPEDRYLIELGIVSYLGIPLMNPGGQVLGHLAVLDIKPMTPDPNRELILRIFAARAGTELERQQAEEKLKASQQKLSFLVQQTPLAVIEWNTHWEIIEWNQAAEVIFGFSKTEMLGKKGVESIVPKKMLTGVNQILEAVTQQKGGNYNINENLRKDGKTIICEWYNTALIDGNNNLIGFAAMAVDITQRQQAEVALRENEQFLRSIYEGVESAIFIVDVLEDNQFHLIGGNPAYERVYGLTNLDLYQKTPEQVFPPEMAKAISERYRLCVAAGEQMSYEELLPFQGKEMWWLTVLTPLRDPEFRIYRLIGTSLNITARKQAEQAIQRRGIIDSMLSDISRIFLDQDINTALNFALQAMGHFTGSSRSYIFRYSEPQTSFTNTHEWCATDLRPAMERALQGSEFHRFQAVPIEALPWLNRQILAGQLVKVSTLTELPPEASLEKAVLEGQGIQAFVNLPIIYQGKVVGFIGLDTLSSPKDWCEEDLNLLKLVGEIIAIGLARHEAEVAQQQATQLALAANRAKSEFLANMSHELRTPLTAILGLSEVLRDEVFGPLTAKQHQKLATIEKSGKHLLELINDVLDLAKIESGKMELQLAETDIQGLCESSLAFVRQQAHQKQIKLSSRVPATLGSVVADERRIRQVLINLLSNAVKFTPEGGQVWIEVHANADNELLQFIVADTGIGIAPEDIRKLFQPFMQLDSSFTRRYKGTGLGLALVRQVVELHGGSVALESEVGNGSRFIISLPWRPGLDQNTIRFADQALTGVANSQNSVPQAPPRVLIVEDSPPAAEQVARYLEELGVGESEIHGLGTGIMEVALRTKPDAIILDLQLPDRSGWEVLGQLKENPQTQMIPVLIISVVDEPTRLKNSGMNAYLMKPFSRSQFQLAWRKLALSQLPPEVASSNAQQLPLILLAEDNETNLSTIVEYLEVKGYRVAVALNGQQAVQMTKQLRPDLILMDIQMPEMDGLEATRLIRAEADLSRIPIIALTSLAMPGDREKCLEAGADEYLAKPVSLKRLVEVVVHYLLQSKS